MRPRRSLLAAFRELEARVNAYKFLRRDGTGVFTGFGWPLPDGGPGGWVETPTSTPAAAASTPAGRRTCRCGSGARCTRSSSTGRSSTTA